ncbi:MAG TPA: omptin family outer membrane protease [Treponemataceae bacterium]|nr:omptin family outer membrane protease [Treponemataceae bacterium]
MNTTERYPKVPRLPLAALLFAAFAALGSPLAAGEFPRPEISLGASGGLTSGEAKEIVYSEDSKLSELVWPLDPAYLLGLDARFQWAKGFGIGANASFGIPREAGTLTDSDFMNVTVTGSSAKTHYSEHDARLDHLVSIDLAASWRFRLPACGIASESPITVMPFAGIRYFSLKWTGSDGYYQYGTKSGKVYAEWSPDMPKVSLSGKIVEYRQEYFAPIAGVEVSCPIRSSFALAAEFTLSPAVWCTDLDEHLLTYTDYHDYLSGGFLVEPRARVSWMPSKTIAAFAEGSWTRMLRLRGKTEAVDTRTGGTTVYARENGGGAEYASWTLKLGVEKTFLRKE